MTPAAARTGKGELGATLCRALFVVWFLLTSFSPDRLTPKPTIFDIPVQGPDLTLTFAALLAFAIWMFTGDLSLIRGGWHRNLPWWFSIVLIYAAVSTLWAGMDRYNSRAMLYSLCFGAAGFILPFFVVASFSPERICGLARFVALGLAFVAAVYCAISFFSLGVRSELGHFYSSGFGLERVKGPLFESSTGHMILLPAAAFLLQDWFDRPRHALVNAIGLVALFIALIGLGSRFALIVVALFLVLAAVTSRGARSFLVTAVAVLAITISVAVVFQYATGERLRSFTDSQRSDTYEASLRVVEDRNLAVNLSGSGYGSIWPWYLRDWDMRDLIATGHMMVATDYGAMLFHPHSVFLLLSVELGAVGLLFFVKLWSALVNVVWQAVVRKRNAFAAIGIACATLGMLADTILFKNAKLSAVWWFFLFATLATQAAEAKGARAQ